MNEDDYLEQIDNLETEIARLSGIINRIAESETRASDKVSELQNENARLESQLLDAQAEVEHLQRELDSVCREQRLHEW